MQPFFENRLGRKSVLTLSLFLAGVLLLPIMGVPEGGLALTIMAGIATVCCGIAGTAGYTYTKARPAYFEFSDLFLNGRACRRI